MISIVQVRELGDVIEKKLRENNLSILDEIPINDFIETFSISKDFSGYHFFNEDSRKIHLLIKSTYPAPIAVDYYRLFLLRYIEKSLSLLDSEIYPVSITEYFKLHFERTYNRILNNNITIDWIDFNQDKFCKEFSVLRLQMIPIGPQLVTINKLSFRMFNRHGIKALLKGLFCVLFITRGVKPIYELHTNHIDPILMRFFNKEGWQKMLIDLAGLMEKNKSMKAVFGAAWFFDPVLKEISPDIAYINQFANETGGCFFKAKTRPSDIKDGTFMNSARKKLFEEGKYNPALYLVIIPRKRLINWSKHQKLI